MVTIQDIKNLLLRINELLYRNFMEIQAKKSLVSANFQCGRFTIANNSGESQDISVIPQNGTFRYLGALFCLCEKKVNTEELQKDIDKTIEKLMGKKISIRNACYIFNHVILQKICYRLSGLTIDNRKIEKMEMSIRKYIKTNLRLTKTFPTRFLYSDEHLVRMRPIRDVLIEQEISNVTVLLQKQSLPGKMMNEYLKKLQLCHPIFSGPIYKTKSSTINYLWRTIKEYNIEFINVNNIESIQNRRYTCQHIKTENHNEISVEISKRKITEVSQVYKLRNNQAVLKNFSDFATKRQLLNETKIPVLW